MNPTNHSSIVALIPARFDATRFRGKLMAKLGDKTVIRRTYDAAIATGLFDEVIVVTDSDIIYNEITSHRGRAIMSKIVSRVMPVNWFLIEIRSSRFSVISVASVVKLIWNGGILII